MLPSLCHIRAFRALSCLQSLNTLSLLRSNVYPSGATQISELLSLGHEDLRGYEAEISRLHCLITTLENERSELCGQLRNCHSLLSPVRRLPVEILREIFQWCCVSSTVSDDEVVVPAVTISQVCAHWRTVAISTKTLWSTINVFWRDDFLKSAKADAAMGLLLSRSADAPLDVTLNLTVACSASLLLARQAARWRSLHFTITSAMENIANEAVKTGLARLTIVECLEDAEANLSGALAILAAAPHLHTARVFDVHDWAIPCDRISTLDMQWCGPASATRALSACHHLKDLTLGFRDVKGEGPEMLTARSVNSGISALTLTFGLDPLRSVETLVHYFLPFVTFPSLSTLQMKTDFSCFITDNILFRSFRSMTARSSCDITSLSLEGVSFSWDALRDFLGSIQSLRELKLTLELSNGPQDKYQGLPVETLFSALHANDGNSSTSLLLPRLTHMSFAFSGKEFTDESFVGMVKSRWRPGSISRGVSCVRSVSLHVLDRRFSVRAFELLGHLRTAGLSLSVQDKDGCVMTRLERGRPDPYIGSWNQVF